MEYFWVRPVRHTGQGVCPIRASVSDETRVCLDQVSEIRGWGVCLVRTSVSEEKRVRLG